MLRSINPFDQSIITQFAFDDGRAIDKKIKRAASAFIAWRDESFVDRAALMRKAGEILLRNKEQYAKTISLEMGKVLMESRAEIEKCAAGCEYFAENAEKFLRDNTISTEAHKSF